MIIQINTDKNIEGRQELEDKMEEQLAKSLNRFAEYITRIEVHLSEENGRNAGPKDKRCLIETRLRNYRPIAVTAHAATIVQALTDAIEKSKRLLDEVVTRKFQS